MGEKSVPQTHDLMVCQILTDLKKTLLEDYLDNLQLNGYPVLKVPPHVAYVARLPCETSMSAKQAINNKLRGRIATV